MRLEAEALRRHLVEELLPFWRAHGVDHARGGFYNAPARDSPPAEDLKRLRVQARQIWAFSQAAQLGAPAWALATAEEGLGALRRDFWDARHGGWYTSTTLEGAPRDRTKHLYDHAFVLFALAGYSRASGDAEALDLAARTLELLEARLADPVHGGFFECATEDWQPDTRVRRQNPHMHLLEALLALWEATGESAYLERAEPLVTLLQTRLLDRERGLLGEDFAPDWSRRAETSGEAVEPGHHFEWVWLLHRWRQAAPSGTTAEATVDQAAALFAFAERFGLDREHGGVFDAVDGQGRRVRETKRLWPQMEHIQARVARLEAHPGAEEREALERALMWTAARYRDPEGGWREHLARDGQPLPVPQRATSVYHVVLALSEAVRVLSGADPSPGLRRISE